MKINKILVVKGDRIIKGNSKKSKEVFEVNTGKLIKILSILKSNEDNQLKQVLSLGFTQKGNPLHPIYA
mgnify:CR=1 FL=1